MKMGRTVMIMKVYLDLFMHLSCWKIHRPPIKLNRNNCGFFWHSQLYYYYFFKDAPRIVLSHRLPTSRSGCESSRVG